MSKSIASLLTFAVTSSLALANGGEGDKSPLANWTPGKGVSLVQDKKFSMSLWGQLQAGWELTEFDNSLGGGTESSFGVERARIALTGNVVNEDLSYRLMFDGTDDYDDGTGSASGGAALKDGWAQWAFSKNEMGNLSLRIGQGLPMHGLESTGCSSGFYFVERSSASRTFGQDRGRDTGAWVMGSHSENKIRWSFGAINDDVANNATNNAEGGANAGGDPTWVANVSFDPMGDITGGKGNEAFTQGDLDGAKDIKGTVGFGIVLDNSAANDSTQYNLNTAWMLGNGLTVQGEYFSRTDDSGTEFDSTGYYVQATYTLPKSGDSAMQWGFGARYNMVDAENNAAFNAVVNGEVSEISLVANAFYHGHGAKTQIEYTIQDEDVSGDTNNILRIQFQLLF